MLEGGDHRGDPELVNVIARGVYDAAQWLTYEGGVSWEHNLLFSAATPSNAPLFPRGTSATHDKRD